MYGKFDVNQLEKLLPSKDCDFYFCGPAGFMTAVFKSLNKQWAVPAAQLHYEYFGPTQDIGADNSTQRPPASCPFATFDYHTRLMASSDKQSHTHLVVAAAVAASAVVVASLLRARK